MSDTTSEWQLVEESSDSDIVSAESQEDILQRRAQEAAADLAFSETDAYPFYHTKYSLALHFAVRELLSTWNSFLDIPEEVAREIRDLHEAVEQLVCGFRHDRDPDDEDVDQLLADNLTSARMEELYAQIYQSTRLENFSQEQLSALANIQRISANAAELIRRAKAHKFDHDSSSLFKAALSDAAMRSEFDGQTPYGNLSLTKPRNFIDALTSENVGKLTEASPSLLPGKPIAISQ